MGKYLPIVLCCLWAVISTQAIAQSSEHKTDAETVAIAPIVTGIEAKQPWNQRHAEGWFWRDLDPELDPEKQITEKEKPTKLSTLTNPDTLYPPLDDPLIDPLATLKILQKAVETSKARAVLQPTEANILNWMRVTNQLLIKNTLLADNAKRLIWRNPELDYRQVRPNSPVALSAYNKEFKSDRREAMRDIAKEYGLYFVIAESCPYCHAMAPYLKRFADNYGFTVIAITIDGGTVPEFPDAKYSPEFAEQLNVKITPAIILAKPSEGVIQPISYGFIDIKELETRIYRLFELDPGKPNYRVSTTRLQP
jgi:conjugal transfer pilus assembly protein TraF